MHKRKDIHDDDMNANVDGVNARNTLMKTHENEDDIDDDSDDDDDDDDAEKEKDDESDGDDGVSNVLMSLLDISLDLLSLRGKAVGSDDVDTNKVRGRR